MSIGPQRSDRKRIPAGNTPTRVFVCENPTVAEAAALDRDDLDSQAQELDISRQVVALPGELYCGPPKSRANCRTIALDSACTRRLVDQAIQQNISRAYGTRLLRLPRRRTVTNRAARA